MTVRDYYQWAQHYEPISPIHRLLQLLPVLTVDQRKICLAYTRIRSQLTATSRFYQTYRKQLLATIDVFAYLDLQKGARIITRLLDILEPIVQFRHDAVTMGFLSLCIRSAPYENYDSVEETLRATLLKELKAAMTANYNAPFNYRPIFSAATRDRFTRLFPNLPLVPEVSARLHNAFRTAKAALQGSLLFPKMSSKTIGTEAQEYASFQINSGYSELIQMCDARTLVGAERYYMETGVRLEGIVEMRSAWKYNDLKPRVYYAQGPSLYHSSKYIQALCNRILDCFDCVHRFDRYQLPDDRMISQNDIFVTYDYSSFTSNLTELHNFTRAMGEFFRGCTVITLDTYEGCISQDVGEMFLTYNEVANECATFDISRVLGEGGIPHVMHVTGMLGVPGNISTSTLLHGIHLCYVIGSVTRGRCVGDDALAKVVGGADPFEYQDFVNQVNNLGEIAKEKFVSWDIHSTVDDAWSYLKQPAVMDNGLFYLDDAFTFPGLELVCDIEDDYHVNRNRSPLDVSKLFIAQWSRLLVRLHNFSFRINESDRLILELYQRQSYKRFSWKRRGGLLPAFPDSTSHLIVPAMLGRDEFGLDWISVTRPYMVASDCRVWLPSVACVTEYSSRWVGAEYTGKKGAIESLMEKLGFIESEVQYQEWRIAELPHNVADQILRLRYDYLYKFTVVREFPFWYDQLVELKAMSPHERLLSAAVETRVLELSGDALVNTF